MEDMRNSESGPWRVWKDLLSVTEVWWHDSVNAGGSLNTLANPALQTDERRAGLQLIQSDSRAARG